jgi:hypothetical protein
VTYAVIMATSTGGPFTNVGLLGTNPAGEGVANIPLPPDTYVSGVLLMRDSDGDGFFDPRIFTGFVVP